MHSAFSQKTKNKKKQQIRLTVMCYTFTVHQVVVSYSCNSQKGKAHARLTRQHAHELPPLLSCFPSSKPPHITQLSNISRCFIFSSDVSQIQKCSWLSLANGMNHYLFQILWDQQHILLTFESFRIKIFPNAITCHQLASLNLQTNTRFNPI